MDESPKYAVPGEGNNSLLLLSTVILGGFFAVILGFVVKLWVDEKKAKNRREALRELGPGYAHVLGENEGSEAEDVVDDAEESLDGDGDDVPRDAFGKKVGKKKLAKLQAKQDARVAREAMLAEREEKKRKEEEDRLKREESEKLQAENERQEREERKRLAEEKAAREHEEYLKLKEAFAVEEEGFDEVCEDEAENLVQKFLNYCRDSKVVNVDDLASMFKLRVPEVVDRLNHFMSSGQLTGVIDDRGKFIYITEEELASVAKFVQQRGRVSLSDLAGYSNRLISLKPNTVNAEA